MDFEILFLIWGNCLWMTRKKFKEEPQQVTNPGACYIDNPSFEPLLLTVSTEEYTDITGKLCVHTFNWKTLEGSLTFQI